MGGWWRRIQRRHPEPLNLLEIEKRRAWVQGGLGTSATLHARHLLGSRETGRLSAGHAARAACFGVLASASALAFRRACCARV
jgi:hypothetical protein